MGGSNITPEEDGDQHSREALHWLIALQEEPEDQALRERFDVWRVTDIKNERAWLEAMNVWNVLGDVPEEQTARARLLPKIPPAQYVDSTFKQQRMQYRWMNRRYIAGASSLFVAVCLLIFSLPAINIWLYADHSTGIAELRKLTLEDGTIVHLGANSAIDVAFEPGHRHVRLLAGEAFFEVVADRTRPFTVDADNVGTTVLGTGFNVRLMSRGAEVSVAHGRVAVSHPKARAKTGPPLKAGDWARVFRGGIIKRGKKSPDLVGAWRAGNLIVHNETVGSVVDRLRRYYRGVIIMIDSNLSARHVTGVYKLNDPLNALRAVVLAHGATVHQFTPGIVVVSRF